MMKVPMDNASNPSSGERVKRLYNKNVELENRRRRSTQARTPSDLNAWQQIRENFETMILEDHAFSEQHEIEYALWQLHYKRIEELRACFSAALASASNTSQAGKGSMRPDRITKIRSQFKTFLSDATGFYHDLMLKIRAKYGLSLDDPESQIVQSEDVNKSAEKKKGFISCHRCLIYLGDLARYKGLYGEDDSKGREFAAASGYYMQASSLWPSSGNPHHQLAILASYSGDELVSVYQYFRSLAVDNPFSTARDNLIMAFEKNRQSYSQLLGDGKASSAKAAAIKMTRKGRGKNEGRFSLKDYRTEENSVKEKAFNIPEIFKSFCIRFIRLNGILFTRTSLETFGEVFATARCDFLELLSSEPEEEFNIGFGAAESGIVIVRIIAILIFQVHNVYRESENQSYAEILQRPVLLQNAFTATFEFMGHILERCLQLHDPSTSYLCPGVLVFVEWLACRPDVAAGSEVEEKQAEARSFFWNNCISLLNKILLSEFLSINEDEDETFFSNRNRYDEGETGNRLALWEDLELRGFLPLAPAHLILDFSSKHSLESDGGIKEKKVRVQRIIAAGKAFANVIRIGEQGIYFDSKLKKFAIGVEPQMSNEDLLTSSFEVPVNEHPREMKMNMVGVQPRPQFYMEGEEEDEVIVFKPLVSDKNVNAIAPEMTPNEVFAPVSNACNGAMKSFVESVPAPHMQNAFDTSFRPPSSLASIAPQQHPEPIQPSSSKWLLEQQTSISNGLNKLSFVDTGIAFKPELQEQLGVVQPTGFSLPYSQCANLSPGSIYSGQIPEIPSKFDAIMYSGANFDRVPVNKSSAFPSNSTRSPVSRPIRHVGPPPGFHPVPPKIVDEPLLVGNMKNDNLQMDDYSWLDGYQMPSSTQGTIFNNTINHSEQKLNHATWSNNSTGTFSFPFPGKQVLGLQVQTENQYNWQDHQFPDNLKLFQEQHQQPQKGNQRSIPLPDQYQGQSLWEGRYFV